MWNQKPTNELDAGILITGLPVLRSLSQESDQFATYSFSIVLTQACDIESYKNIINDETIDDEKFTNRQRITQVLLCPLFDEDKFKMGTHLQNEFNFHFDQLNSKLFSNIKKNRDIRYHFIQSSRETIPNTIIDFKQYFTLPVDLVSQHIQDHSNESLKLDHIVYTQISDRFAHYIQRVAIP